MQDAEDPVRAAMQAVNFVHAAINGRNTHYIGRTWAEFKRVMEQDFGITDEDVVSLRMNGTVAGTGWVERYYEGRVQVVREVLR